MEADARHRLAQVGLAMYRYRAQNGRFPQALEALAPAFIPVLPRDPYDGKPLKLKQTERGAVIYSVGPDVQDGDGSRFDRGHKTGDLTFECQL